MTYKYHYLETQCQQNENQNYLNGASIKSCTIHLTPIVLRPTIEQNKEGKDDLYIFRNRFSFNRLSPGV